MEFTMNKRLWMVFLLFMLTAPVNLPDGWSSGGICDVAMAQESDGSIQKIAVMPFLIGKRPEDVQEMISCPIERLCADENELMENAGNILTQIVQRTVESRFGDKTVPLADVKEAYEKFVAVNSKSTPRLLAQRLGEALGTDVIILGNIWRYRERDPKAFDPPSGASVAFNIVLLKVETGQRVWKGTFDKTQRTLSDNVLSKGSFKRVVKWLSVNELARLGVQEVFKNFPY
jgi:hypothetical protein